MEWKEISRLTGLPESTARRRYNEALHPRAAFPTPPEQPAVVTRLAARLGADNRRETATVSDAPQTGRLEKVLIVPDVHAPYHSEVGWNLLLQVARREKPDRIWILGDFADFYGVSDHDKNPTRANRMDWEIDVANAMLDELDAIGATDKVYVEGNHEDRLRRHLMKHPALHNVVSTEKLLRLKERGWSFVPYKDHIKRGAAHLTHDVGSAGRTAVFNALALYQGTIITAHTHRLAYIVEGSATGECKLSASFGWLGDVEAVEYMTRAKARKEWALAFGWGYYDPASEYVYLAPIPIVHATCCVGGVIYRAAPARAA